MRHLIGGAAIVVACLFGATGAGAAPVPATLTYTVAQNSAGTQEIVALTVTNTSGGNSGFFDYGCYVHATQCAPDFGVNGSLALADGQSSTFHYTYPCGTPGGDVDIADPYNNYDLALHWTWDGQCVPPTTTTTTPTTVPTTTPPPTTIPPTAPPTQSVIPQAQPQTSLAPVGTAPAGALAVTGMNLAPLLEMGTGLLALGSLLVLTEWRRRSHLEG